MTEFVTLSVCVGGFATLVVTVVVGCTVTSTGVVDMVLCALGLSDICIFPSFFRIYISLNHHCASVSVIIDSHTIVVCTPYVTTLSAHVVSLYFI